MGYTGDTQCFIVTLHEPGPLTSYEEVVGPRLVDATLAAKTFLLPNVIELVLLSAQPLFSNQMSYEAPRLSIIPCVPHVFFFKLRSRACRSCELIFTIEFIQFTCKLNFRFGKSHLGEVTPSGATVISGSTCNLFFSTGSDAT